MFRCCEEQVLKTLETYFNSWNNIFDHPSFDLVKAQLMIFASPSGLPLIFRQDNGKSDAAGQFEEHELARSVSPLLFCYTDKEQPAM